MTISANAIASRIASLTIHGLNIRDLDKIPEALEARDCPVIYPVSEKFMVLEGARQVSLGERALWEYTYTLTYRYVSAPAGSERGVSKIIANKTTGYIGFITTIARSARSLGANYIRPANTPEMGILKDPSGVEFQAADIILRVIEFSAD